ncbi:MAG: type I-B CRISPR-associated protein Cas5b [Hydrogenobacter sp.]|uniref:type I-B CRISPR-associated protein Cas5b n=1 Tax=Hydrogenobacter thermophilus TaxID=940 RepID=UPI0030FA9585
MEVLKFELFSPTACFKTPFSLKGIETYPLPTYSTIIGLLYTALGRKWQGERFDISLQGRYETLFRDLVRFRKYNFKDKVLETLPLSVPTFRNLKVVVHIRGEKSLIEQFKNALEKPANYLFLSGGEYPVKISKVSYVSVKQEERTVRNRYYLTSDIYASEKSNVDVKFAQKTGICYRLPHFLKSLEPREYMWTLVYYYPAGTPVYGKLLIDQEGDTVWLCDFTQITG